MTSFQIALSSPKYFINKQWKVGMNTFIKKLIALLSLSILLITNVSYGMELRSTQNSLEACDAITHYLLTKQIYKAIDKAKDKKEAANILSEYYDNNFETRSLLNDRRVSRTIKDTLRAKFPGIVVSDLYPFNQMRFQQQKELKRLEATQHPDQAIGTYLESDIESIRKIFRDNYKNLLILPDRCNLEEVMSRDIFYNPTLTVIRNENNEVVGFTTYKFGKPDIWALHIEMLGIDKEYQKKGYGKRLIQYLADQAKDQGFSRLHLSSAPASVGFYQKMGFSPDVIHILSLPVWKCRIGDHPILQKDINT